MPCNPALPARSVPGAIALVCAILSQASLAASEPPTPSATTDKYDLLEELNRLDQTVIDSLQRVAREDRKGFASASRPRDSGAGAHIATPSADQLEAWTVLATATPAAMQHVLVRDATVGNQCAQVLGGMPLRVAGGAVQRDEWAAYRILVQTLVDVSAGEQAGLLVDFDGQHAFRSQLLAIARIETAPTRTAFEQLVVLQRMIHPLLVSFGVEQERDFTRTETHARHLRERRRFDQ